MDFSSLFGSDFKTGIFVILNLIFIESILSIDNAAVLATMVMRLPEKQRDKALKYGILGAYFFRGLSLLFASILLKFVFLKALGGLYLIYLTIKFFMDKHWNSGESNETEEEKNTFFLDSVLGTFWSTVALVEVMDLAFSIDNVFAAVAFSNKIGLIWVGVAIGILAMRFVSQIFVKLLERYPFLENIAFVVIGLLGMKLINSFACGIATPISECNGVEMSRQYCDITTGHLGDVYTSIITMLLFIIPMVWSAITRKYK